MMRVYPCDHGLALDVVFLFLVRLEMRLGAAGDMKSPDHLRCEDPMPGDTKPLLPSRGQRLSLSIAQFHTLGKYDLTGAPRMSYKRFVEPWYCCLESLYKLPRREESLRVAGQILWSWIEGENVLCDAGAGQIHTLDNDPDRVARFWRHSSMLPSACHIDL